MEELKSLISRAQTSDLDAFETIVERFQDMAVGYAHSIMGDFHLAQDAAQEAFIGAYENFSQLHAPEAFLSWFRKIIFTHCHRLMRRKQIETVPLEAAVEMPTDAKLPSEILEERETKEMVLSAIAGLPEKQREATTLFYISGYSQKEIADFLEVPVSTVDNRLRDSRKRLRTTLSSERMPTMVKETLHENAPSRDDSFVNIVGICNAAQAGDLEQIKTIIKVKPALAHTDGERGYQAIHYAARVGHAEIVRTLLESGANPHRGIQGERASALAIARHNGHTDVVEVIENWLAEKSGSTPEGITLCDAVRQGELDRVYQMLDDDPSLIHTVNMDGNTALHVAVQTREMRLILELLNRGAEVDRKNRGGHRPIHVALAIEPKRGFDPPPDPIKRVIAGMLLARGATYDLWTVTALDDIKTAQAILEEDPDAAKDYRRPEYHPGADGYPLIIAAYNGHLEIARLLLEHGADPDTPYDAIGGYHVAERGEPLLWACANDDYEMAKLLLEHGTNADTVKDSSGNALDRAVQYGNDLLIKLLLRHGAIPGYSGKVEPGFYAMHSDNIATDAALIQMQPEVAGDMLPKVLCGGHPDLVALCFQHDPEIDDERGLHLLEQTSRM